MGKKPSRRKIPISAAQEEAAEDNRLLEFSFKHLDSSDNKFDLDGCEKDYLCSLLRQIQNYSNYTVEQFRDFNHTSDRNTIDPEQLHKRLDGKMLDEQLLDSEAWELKLGTLGSHWRAHGLLIYNTFYIIWLDPKHKLFESRHPKHNQPKAKR